MAKKEYIERNKIIEMLEESLEDKKRWLKKATDFVNIYVAKNDIKQLNFAMTCVKALLADITSADVEPVKHGEWQEITTHNGCTYDYDCVCSICGKSGIPSYDFCPHCGAKMDGKDKTNDEL